MNISGGIPAWSNKITNDNINSVTGYYKNSIRIDLPYESLPFHISLNCNFIILNYSTDISEGSFLVDDWFNYGNFQDYSLTFILPQNYYTNDYDGDPTIRDGTITYVKHIDDDGRERIHFNLNSRENGFIHFKYEKSELSPIEILMKNWKEFLLAGTISAFIGALVSAVTTLLITKYINRNVEKKENITKWKMTWKNIRKFVDRRVIPQIAKLLGLLLAFSILFELIYNVSQGNASNLNFLKDYAVLSATFFGFTLIGAVFEKRKERSDKKTQKALKKLFDISISFLFCTIAFLWGYTFQFIINGVLESYLGQIWTYLTILFLGTGIALFAMAIFSLFITLFDYRKNIK